MFSYVRQLFAPITLRFFATDGLIETLEFLDLCDLGKVDADTAKFAERTKFIIAKELLRRKVRIWEF